MTASGRKRRMMRTSRRSAVGAWRVPDPSESAGTPARTTSSKSGPSSLMQTTRASKRSGSSAGASVAICRSAPPIPRLGVTNSTRIRSGGDVGISAATVASVSLRRATGRGTAWAFIGYLAHYGVTFVFTVITARLLSPEVFGIMGLAVVVIAVGTLLADSGTQAALVHREDDDDLDVAVNTALISTPLAGLGAAALGIAAAPLLAWFYGESQVFAVAALLSGVLFVRSFGLVPDALLQRRLQFKWRRAVVDPLAAFVGGATATILALAGAGVWSLVAMWYANTLTVVLGSWFLVRYRPRLRLASFAMWRQLAHYGRNILGAHTVQLAFGYLDTLTVGRTLSPTFVGWYGAATRLAILPAQATTYVAGAALFPAFTRMRDDVPRLRAAFLEAIRYIALLAFPLFAILAVISEPFVVVLFGEQWRPTGPVLAVMMLWVLPLSLFEPSMELFKAIGQPGRVFRLAIVKFVSFADLPRDHLGPRLDHAGARRRGPRPVGGHRPRVHGPGRVPRHRLDAAPAVARRAPGRGRRARLGGGHVRLLVDRPRGHRGPPHPVRGQPRPGRAGPPDGAGRGGRRGGVRPGGRGARPGVAAAAQERGLSDLRPLGRHGRLLVSRVGNRVAVPGCIPSRCGVLDPGDGTTIAGDLRPCLAGDSLGNCIRTSDSGH